MSRIRVLATVQAGNDSSGFSCHIYNSFKLATCSANTTHVSSFVADRTQQIVILNASALPVPLQRMRFPGVAKYTLHCWICSGTVVEYNTIPLHSICALSTCVS